MSTPVAVWADAKKHGLFTSMTHASPAWSTRTSTPANSTPAAALAATASSVMAGGAGDIGLGAAGVRRPNVVGQHVVGVRSDDLAVEHDTAPVRCVRHEPGHQGQQALGSEMIEQTEQAGPRVGDHHADTTLVAGHLDDDGQAAGGRNGAADHAAVA